MGGLMFLGTYTNFFDSAISPWTTLGMRVLWFVYVAVVVMDDESLAILCVFLQPSHGTSTIDS
jgi:hypothetical protein